MSARPSRALALATALALGCRSVPLETGFDDVAQRFEERTGETLVWRRGGPEDAALEARVRELLAGELTADTAVRIALLSNRRLQARYAELGLAQADLLAASRPSNPLLHGELRFPEGGGRAALDLGIEQEFLSLLFMPVRIELAEQGLEIAELGVTRAALALAGETRRAFLRLQAADERLGLVRASAEAAALSAELGERLLAAGNLRELDADLLRLQREEARSGLARAEFEQLERREALVRWLGLFGDDVELVPSGQLPALPDEPGSGEDLERRAVAQDLSLEATRLEIERAGRRLGLTGRTALMNSLGLGLAAERESDGSWALGPSFSLPLPLFSAGGPAQRRALSELLRLRENYVAEAVELRSHVRTAGAKLFARHAEARFLRDVVVPLRARIVDGLQVEYNAMLEGAFRLIEARRGELAARMQALDATGEYWVAESELESLLDGAGALAAVPSMAAANSSVPSFSAESH